MRKTIAVAGRPNVGKSSLFNALLGRREALTSPNPGLTRDRSYARYSPDETREYILIDTGGLILGSGEAIDEKVNLQVEVALRQADLILFVTDALEGLTPMDEMVADMLRVSTKPVILAANKADSPEKDVYAADFWGLGFGEPVAVSALHRRNIYSLEDRITGAIPTSAPRERQGGMTTLCLAGKPNVGKSTLINAITGEERSIVDETPGTTRNPARCFVEIGGRQWELVDLAGMWRKKSGKEAEEVISMLASRREIENSDLCVFLLDLTKPLTFQDKRIAGWIIEAGTSVVIAGNKSDLVELNPEIRDAYRQELFSRIPHLDFAPFVVISAKAGDGLEDLYAELEKVRGSSLKNISQESLDALLLKMTARRPPPEVAQRRPVPAGLYQDSTSPPVFRLVMNHYRLDKLPQHWINYVRNSIRREYGYYGSPVTVKVARGGRKK